MNPEDDDYSHISDEDTMGEDVGGVESIADSKSENTDDITDESGVLSQKTPTALQKTTEKTTPETSETPPKSDVTPEGKVEGAKDIETPVEGEKKRYHAQGCDQRSFECGFHHGGTQEQNEGRGYLQYQSVGKKVV